MDILFEALSVAEILSKADIEWAFAGGVAVGIHGFVRATEDIDIVVKPEDLNKLDELLKERGFVFNKESVQFKNGFSLYRRIKIMGEDHFTLDILIPPKENTDLLLNRQEGTIMGNQVYVLAKSDLIEMKGGTGRKKDQMDVEELEKL